MLRYKLRTLLILLAVGPPLLAVAWWFWEAALALVALALILEPALFIDAIALCHLMGGKPGGRSSDNSN